MLRTFVGKLPQSFGGLKTSLLVSSLPIVKIKDGNLQKFLRTNPLRVRIYYTDNTSITKEFNAEQELRWFLHNEGDHVLKVEELGRTYSDCLN
jgi:hypothetical protein